MIKILVIDDGDSIREYCEQFLKNDYKIDHATRFKNAQLKISQSSPDIILLDKVFQIPEKDLVNPASDPSREGYFIAKKIKQKYPNIPIIMISYYDPMETAEESMEFGIEDFIEWDALENDPHILETRINRLVEKTSGNYSENLKREFQRFGFIGNSPIGLEIVERIREVAAADSNVLLVGETGTGKDLTARIIHNLSQRSAKPFVELNLCDLPENLIEDELFGHVKGAFTGAVSEKISKLELARNGTIFLNEIGEISKAVQVKLLQVIENKTFTRLGGVKPIQVNVRFIFATNKHLEELVDNGQFRKDLYYRIKSHPIILKPLAERKEDIPDLIRFFLNEFNKSYETNKHISNKCIEYFRKKTYRGNIRQLKNIVRNVYDISGDTITLRDIIKVFKDREKLSQPNHPTEKKDNHNLKYVEKEQIKQALENNNGSVKNAARDLGISPATLYRRIKQYKLKD